MLKKNIIFLGCGKNQWNAIKTAKDLGFYVIGVDVLTRPFSLSLLDRHIKASKLDFHLKFKDYSPSSFKPDICISFSPGPAMFACQKIKNTIGEKALKIIENSLKWLSLFKKNGIAIPEFFPKFIEKPADNTACGALGVRKSGKKRFAQQFLSGKSFYGFFLIKHGQMFKQSAFMKQGKSWHKTSPIFSCFYDLEKIIKILEFRSGAFIIETIDKKIIDIGIELEPMIVEQTVSYKEIFELYE